MEYDNKRLFKLWAKHFGSFLSWVVGGSALGYAFTQMPLWLVPWAATALLIAGGGYVSLAFARSDYKLDELKQKRIMDALAREPRN